MPDVYATARGPLARVAGPLAARARARRHELLFGLTGLQPGARVLDVGCGSLGLRALEPALDITGVDLVERPEYPGPFVRADAAAELRRVGRGWFVQTPAYSFPIEPHALLPFAHWLPPRVRRPYWRLGAAAAWEEISLLRRAEMEALFGPARAERFGPLVKSWVCVSPSGG